MNPIDHLLEEHRAIMHEMEGLRFAVNALREGGDGALPGVLPALRSANQVMATTLLRHARKEDEALFPAVERVLGAGEGPTAVMRGEHRAIHGQAERFRQTLRTLQEVEHPAILAGEARLRTLASDGDDAVSLADTGEEILGLLDLHFAKEEEVLFPLAREILSSEEMSEVAAAIEGIAAS